MAGVVVFLAIVIFFAVIVGTVIVIIVVAFILSPTLSVVPRVVISLAVIPLLLVALVLVALVGRTVLIVIDTVRDQSARLRGAIVALVASRSDEQRRDAPRVC